MSDTILRTLKNTVPIPQSIVFRGQQFILAANEEQTFDAAVADKFLEICGPAVVDTSEALGRTYAPELERKTMWIANMTGNPDAPATVIARRPTANRRWEDVPAPNPNKEARTAKREMKGGHRAYIARDGGLVQETNPSTIWEVPPFRRRPMPEEIARWFIDRDSQSPEGRGCCIVSRPQSDFEPDMSWRLDDMRSYFRLVDATTDLGIGENELSAKAAKQKWTADKLKEEMRAAKQTLFRRLYFRLVDPAYRLPTRKEFNEFLTGKSEEQIEEEQMQALLEKAKVVNSKEAAAG